MPNLAAPSWVTRTLFAFGSPGRDWYGHLVLRPDGSIGGYEHPNERTWSWENETLALRNANGEVSSHYRAEGKTFVGRATTSGYPLLLHPILRLPEAGPSSLPPVLINSVPKAGTYFLEASLTAAGWQPTRLHLGPGTVDDYRGVTVDEMHREPHKHRALVPEDVSIAVLAPGTVTVAHLPNPDIQRLAANQGALVINLVRNLRAVVESFYRFRRDRVLPIRPIDHALAGVPPEEALAVFMALEAERSLALVGDVARGVLSAEAPIVRYEDCVEGHLGSSASTAFDGIRPGMSTEVGRCLKETVGQPTSTLSAGRHSLHWSEGANMLFRAVGLKDLNIALGYAETGPDRDLD